MYARLLLCVHRARYVHQPAYVQLSQCVHLTVCVHLPDARLRVALGRRVTQVCSERICAPLTFVDAHPPKQPRLR